MREILFRGKWTRNGKWIEGFYARIHDGKGNVSHRIYTGDAESDCGDFYPENFEVDPSTVGQYTGLTANGEKIFEGDIIKYKNTDGVKFNGVALTVIGKVVYNEKNASFAISGKDEIGAKHYDYFTVKNIEVIGNKWDNPELLEGEG